MSRKDVTEEKLAVPQVKKLLETIGEENLDQLQRRTFDYVSKFSKVDAQVSKKLIEKLVADFGLEEEESIQIANCMPRSVDELRVFLTGGRKIIDVAMLRNIVTLLEENRELK